MLNAHLRFVFLVVQCSTADRPTPSGLSVSGQIISILAGLVQPRLGGVAWLSLGLACSEAGCPALSALHHILLILILELIALHCWKFCI